MRGLRVRIENDIRVSAATALTFLVWTKWCLKLFWFWDKKNTHKSQHPKEGKSYTYYWIIMLSRLKQKNGKISTKAPAIMSS